MKPFQEKADGESTTAKSSDENGQTLTTTSDQAQNEPGEADSAATADSQTKSGPGHKSVEEDQEEDLSVFNRNVSVGRLPSRASRL